MSAPNKDFDPVEVAILKPEAIAQAVESAVVAFSTCQTFDEQIGRAHV